MIPAESPVSPACSTVHASDWASLLTAAVFPGFPSCYFSHQITASKKAQTRSMVPARPQHPHTFLWCVTQPHTQTHCPCSWLILMRSEQHSQQRTHPFYKPTRISILSFCLQSLRVRQMAWKEAGSPGDQMPQKWKDIWPHDNRNP